MKKTRRNIYANKEVKNDSRMEIKIRTDESVEERNGANSYPENHITLKLVIRKKKKKRDIRTETERYVMPIELIKVRDTKRELDKLKHKEGT